MADAKLSILMKNHFGADPATEDELTSSNNLLLQVGNALKSLPADKVQSSSENAIATAVQRYFNSLPEISDVTGAKMVGVKGNSAGSVGSGNFASYDKVEDIEKGSESYSNEIAFESDDGEEIAKVNENGLFAKKIYANGVDVNQALENKIDKSENIEEENENTGKEEIIFKDIDNNDVVKITNDGIFSKGFFDENGKKISSKKIIVAPSGGDYSSFTEAMVEAVKTNGTEVFVKDGVYDILAEYRAKYGDSFFENMTSSETNLGIVLRNSVKVVFSSRAFITFNYDGSNNNVMNLFSPFSMEAWRTYNNFELVGLKINAKNCRYIVHDEMGGNNTPYEHNYIDCEMNLDNTASVPNPASPTWHYKQCIGGGLGKYGKIFINGCKFYSKDFETLTGSCVSWHNAAMADAESVIDVQNSYFANGGTFRISWYGQSTKITRAFVCGCRVGVDVIHSAENAAAYDVRNTQLNSWNNEVQGE